jgi:hypothetical protein
MMSPEEIIQRFQRLFKREMTPEERAGFFLPFLPSDSNSQQI